MHPFLALILCMHLNVHAIHDRLIAPACLHSHFSKTWGSWQCTWQTLGEGGGDFMNCLNPAVLPDKTVQNSPWNQDPRARDWSLSDTATYSRFQNGCPKWPMVKMANGKREGGDVTANGGGTVLQSISEWLSKMVNGKWCVVTANGVKYCKWCEVLRCKLKSCTKVSSRVGV